MFLQTLSALFGILLGLAIAFSSDVYQLGGQHGYQFLDAINVLIEHFQSDAFHETYDLMPWRIYAWFAAALIGCTWLIKYLTSSLYADLLELDQFGGSNGAQPRKPQATTDNLYHQLAATSAEAAKMRDPPATPEPRYWSLRSNTGCKHQQKKGGKSSCKSNVQHDYRSIPADEEQMGRSKEHQPPQPAAEQFYEPVAYQPKRRNNKKNNKNRNN